MSVFSNGLQEHKNSGTVRPQTMTTLTQKCRVNFISTRLTRRLPWFSAERAESNANGWDQPQCRSILLIYHFRVLLVSIACNYVKYLQITFYHIIRESSFFLKLTQKGRNKHKRNERRGFSHDVADLWVYHMGIFSREQ